MRERIVDAFEAATVPGRRIAVTPGFSPTVSETAAFGSLVPAGDLDGDGLGDALNEAFPDRQTLMRLEARRGSNGQFLWQRSFGAVTQFDPRSVMFLGAILGHRLDGGPTADVLVIEYRQMFGLVFVSTLTITAIAGEDGRTLSTVEFRGARVEYNGQPTRQFAVDSPARPGGEAFFWIGPDADGDGGDDVLLGALNGSDTGGSGTWDLDAKVVSLASGRTISSSRISGRNSVPYAWLVPDRSGDGLADVVGVSPNAVAGAGSIRVLGFEGTTGRLLSQSAAIDTGALYFRSRAPDLDGNDRSDLFLTGWSTADINPRFPLETWGVGDGGALLWRRPGAPMIPSGDVDGDGTDDVLHGVVVPTPDGPSVRYTAYRGQDLQTIWSVVHGPVTGSNFASFDSGRGDFDGDRLADPYIIFATSSDGGSTLTNGTVRAISGRTGSLMWVRALPRPTVAASQVPQGLWADVDGVPGDELIVLTTSRTGQTSTARAELIAGQTGVTVWGPLEAATLVGGSGPFAFAAAHDGTGDGLAEIFVSLKTQSPPYGYTGSVLFGGVPPEGGTVLWVLS